MLDIFILIGTTTLTLSGIVGAIILISWPERPQNIKEMHLKWKISLIVEAVLALATLVFFILSVVFWFINGRKL
ncbi:MULTISPECIES: hypothetical protein [unclassified Butyrivibrio]|uniref:hypothetical protein n=1 Tax=unclassified Butyrivibrio TaxID=2639466 RepID=UPI00040EEE23|nr:MULTISPECIES: hypothetical protein [unclassified Butyrivibrio]